jgi:type II pantothenate kinase
METQAKMEAPKMEISTKRKTDTRNLVRAGILTALIIAMTFIPQTGYITVGPVAITTLHIVVIVGAAMLGWKYGAFLGLVWGLTCVALAYIQVIPLTYGFGNVFVAVLPRILVGVVTGFVYQGLQKAKLRQKPAHSITALAGTLTNTMLVLPAMYIYMGATMTDIFKTLIATLVGINFTIEVAAAILIVPAILAAVKPRELVLGIDIGSSTTKFALVKNGKCIKQMRKPDDQSFEEALEAFGYAGVKRIAITGVGASFIKGDLRGVPTKRADEFTSVSRGALHLARRHNCLVVSVGTGTSFTRVTPFRTWHIGGTGMGGGLLKGLSGKVCGTDDMEALQQLAARGDLHEIDLQLMDVCEGTISNLTPNTTVANMSKLSDESTKEDIAAGLCNMIFQVIGVMAAFAIKRHCTKNIILVGTITDWPIAKRSLDEVAELHKVKFIIPDHAAFATAIGAALAE